MQSWHLRFLGIDTIPGWLSDREIERFFTLSPTEIAAVRTRHGDLHKLGLALHIGFLRLAGCALNGTDILPRRLLLFVGAQLEIKTPRVSSLRALYPRKPTLHEHQHIAQAVLGFRVLNTHVERHLIAYLQLCAKGTINAIDLIGPARAWLYEHRYLIVGERELLNLCRRVLRTSEQAMAKRLNRQISKTLRQSWLIALTAPHLKLTGITQLEWLKRSPRSRRGRDLVDAFERVQFLQRLGIHQLQTPEIPLTVVKAYAARIGRLKLTRYARLRTVSRDIGLPCFLQLCLWRTTDEAIEAWLMRVSEIRRNSLIRGNDTQTDWQTRHNRLIDRLASLSALAPPNLAAQIGGLVTEARATPPSNAQRARTALLGMGSQIRRLLRLLIGVHVECTHASDWLRPALERLKEIYSRRQTVLSGTDLLDRLPPLWRRVRATTPAERLQLLEAATLLQLHRALRNGSVVVHGSLSFRERESLLIPAALWAKHREQYLDPLGSDRSLADFTRKLVPGVVDAMAKLARSVRQGDVLVDDHGIRLAAAESPDPSSANEHRWRRIGRHLGTIELPQLMMQVDAEVRFSTSLLRRTPRREGELLALYGAILAHGMGLDQTQVRRMMPSVPIQSLPDMMTLLEDEGRLTDANAAIVQHMRRHPIVATWGDPGLASADMMTIAASHRLWNARTDPRTGSYAIGTYTHVLDQWGIAYDQPIVLNRRQAGAALEGVLFQRIVPIELLAVDTHGYTDVAMGLARLLGFDLCPRLAMLRERKLYTPEGLYVPKRLRPIAVGVSIKALREQWDGLLRLAASIREGWCSANQVLSRFGSDAQGDPLYRAAVSFGRLVRTQYLCRYFSDSVFRARIRRALNHGESIHQLQRTIHPYAIGAKRGRSREEQRAISGALALLANLVMAWNTHQLQALAEKPDYRRLDVSDEDLTLVGPVATSHINFRGVLSFPLKELGEPVMRPPVRMASL